LEAAVLARLAHLGIARPRRVLLALLIVLLAAAAFGGPAAGRLNAPRAFDDPGSQATHARQQLTRATGRDPSPEVLALVSAPPQSAAVAHARQLLAADPAVAAVVGPTTSARSPLVSRDGRQTLLAATLRGGVDVNTVAKRLDSTFKGDRAVKLGGDAVSGMEVGRQATKDLAIAELIAFPLLALLSLLIFRGVAALLPLALGGLAVLSSFALLRAVNGALALSPFALNLVIGLGLGLAVDYSLFCVSRFREELGRGAEVPDAVRATLATAGRTVLFSAATVAAAMACLTVFPQRFLVSMGIGGAIVALVAAASTLLALPPLLMLLGPRLGKVKPAADGSGRWYRLARGVMRRPGRVALAATLVMLVIAVPTLNLHWTAIDATALPSGQSARVVSDTLTRDFPSANASPLTLAVSAPQNAGPALAAYARELDSVAGVRSVSLPRALGDGTWQIDVASGAPPAAAASQQLVAALRAQPAPYPVLVGGTAADLHDQRAAVGNALPLALALLVVLTLTVLWLMTGSVLLPLKALVLNLLTTAAATGAIVFAFQGGYFGLAKQPGIELTDFLVMVAMIFGLATDYGVLVLTRIKEGHDRGLPDREAVASGLQRSGAVVTAASILLAVALGAFVTGKLVFLQELGAGAALAVLLDAFVVRSLLVPALMGLLGAANWWAPRPLRRLYARLGTRASAVTFARAAADSRP
jgi:RND superfamily putative drug exporter